MYKVEIVIRGENDAFYDNDKVNVHEFKRILMESIEKINIDEFIEAYKSIINANTIKLYDINGNFCGHIGIDYQK